VLAKLGFALSSARQEIEQIIGKGSGFVAVEIPFTPNAKKLMESAWEIAQIREHDYIGTEHLLAGLLETRNGIALRVLEGLYIREEAIEDELEKTFGPSSSESDTLTEDELERVRLKVKIHLCKRKADIAQEGGEHEVAEQVLRQKTSYEQKLTALEKRIRESGT